ncbi:18S rRNA maturation protein [Marasmius crinis-equi]|uniref:rRNA-processing protein EFG1 n=1 Tax=Marasmius crinis-equi TaxID=585013 RepID=A0ABR3ERK7_9AGAR
MGPVRTQKHSSSSRPKQAPHNHNHKRKPNPNSSDPNALPGVQKIKASIRQARRLLAKDKLNADIRVQTERKLKSLEEDLARAEENRKEKTMATRYHKVKFFERQKVTRKIKQTIRKLEAEAEEDSEVKKELFELRVDLNYILHYPKTKKYISLFPPEARHDPQKSEPTTASTDAEREEVRRWIREQMEKGDLPAEPESAPENGVTSTSKKAKAKWDKDKDKKARVEEEKDEDEKDDFFEDADEEEEDEDS